ncbi:MAG: hypothetical protein RIF42_04070, partial [Parvibaculaceae bacterium]
FVDLWSLTRPTFDALEEELYRGDEVIKRSWESGSLIFLDSEESETLIESGTPAANRYVTVRDNQEPFDTLSKTLDEVCAEFAKDHNKGDVDGEVALEFLAEADGTIAQIKRGKVRVAQLIQGLDPAIRRVLPYLSAYPGLVDILNDVLEMIRVIVESIGNA